MKMSIREWSVRLGLYTPDQESEWFGRDIGHPKDSPEFRQQAAWKLLIPEHTPEFQPTISKADCIRYPILRLAQVSLSYNLLGQGNTSSTVTEAELYFMWCMKEQRRVHLGYWIARTCHAIAIRASLHLNICHILGALVRNCFELRVDRGISSLAFCPNPELFNTKFFVNVNVLVRKGGKLHFYKVTQPKLQVAKIAEVEKEKGTLIETAPPATHAEPVEPVEPVEQVDEWRVRMEGLVERLALNVDAQTKLLSAKTDMQMNQQREIRAASTQSSTW